MSKTFLYRFSDGSEIYREPTRATMDEIAEICKEQGIELVFNGFTDQLESIQTLRANSHTRGDGFKPGWNPALGMEIRTHGQYQSVLKERGLVEVGNEKRKDAPKAKSNLGEEIVKEAIKQGAELSGNEIKKLTGEIK